MTERSLVVVPTYDEAPNIAELLRAIRRAAPRSDVLVVDDASPDGTAGIVEQVAAELGQISVLNRPAKEGLGNAYRDAFARALAEGYDVIVTMDADFSHDPNVVPVLLGAVADGGDLVVGSRYVPGGSTPHWPWYRLALSRYGNRYSGWILDLGVSDATSGFRAYRAELLRAIDVEGTRSNGYAFMTELAARIGRTGAGIVEVPITFHDRVRGTSKMSSTIIVESMLRVTAWGLKERWARLRLRRRPPGTPEAEARAPMDG